MTAGLSSHAWLPCTASGVLAIRARTVRDERRGPVGLQQKYTESGALESEVTYDKGTVARRRNYKDGKLVLEEEYFEDGSRKSSRKSE